MPTNYVQVVAYAVLFFLLADAVYYLLLIPVSFGLAFLGRSARVLLFAAKQCVIVAFCSYFVTCYLQTTERSKSIAMVLLLIAVLINGVLEAGKEQENEHRNNFGRGVSTAMVILVVISALSLFVLQRLELVFFTGMVRWFPFVTEWMKRTPVINIILWIYTYIGFFALTIYQCYNRIAVYRILRFF